MIKAHDQYHGDITVTMTNAINAGMSIHVTHDVMASQKRVPEHVHSVP